MKKVLSLISLLLVFAMLAAAPVYAEEAESAEEVEATESVQESEIAEETEATEEEDRVPFEAPRSSPIYYANNIEGQSIPVIDGEIKEGEYGKITSKLVDHIKLKNVWPESGYAVDPDRVDYCSESIDFYIAYDENYFYLAFVDYGSKWEAKEGDQTANFTARNNYSFGVGFQLDDLTNYFSLSIEGQRISGSFSDGKTSNFTQVDGGFASIVSEAYLKKYLKDDPTKVFCDADITTLGGKNVDSKEGQYVAVCEMKFDKKLMLERFNEYAYTEYAELPNAMFFHMTARSYVLNPDLETDNENCTSYNKYFAADISGLNQTQMTKFYMDYGILPGSPQQYIPSVVVFGEEGTTVYHPREIETPDLPEEEEIEPEYEPITEEMHETLEPKTETLPADAEGGCGSTVSVAAFALVAALGACTVFASKKK